jgi:DNA ligase-1
MDPALIDWKKFKFEVFDVPTYPDLYQHRYSFLGMFDVNVLSHIFLIFPTVETLGDKPHPFIEVVKKEVCKNKNHMEEFLQNVVDMGGEGIILRDPLASNESGRSKGFLKHKVD